MNAGKLARCLLLEAAFPRLTLPQVEQAAMEADCDPWTVAFELLDLVGGGR